MTSNYVKSYFRVNGGFVPIDHFVGEFPDNHYIEGAIVCRVDGREIFTRQHWDLVDQLWAYILEGLRKLDQGQIYDAFFPDQPLRLRFETVSPNCVRVTIGDNSITVSTISFQATMKRGALDFFIRMKDINPEAVDTWDRYQKEAELVKVHDALPGLSNDA